MLLNEAKGVNKDSPMTTDCSHDRSLRPKLPVHLARGAFDFLSRLEKRQDFAL